MKSQLIEKQGKYYKECEVLPLYNKSGVIQSVSEINKLYKYPHNILNNDDIVDNLGIRQHLYFLSDEEIKDGDWCVREYYPPTKGFTRKVEQFFRNKVDFGDSLSRKKIIATTDNSLRNIEYDGLDENAQKQYSKIKLPQPSPEFIQAFIEAYNSGKPITKVLVEYNEICHKCHNLRENKTCCSPVKEYHKNNHEYVLKLKDNQIIIKKIEERMYSELEVLGFLRKYKKHFHLEIDTEKELLFIENNLK